MKNVSKSNITKPKKDTNSLVETSTELAEIDNLKEFFAKPVLNENKLLQEYKELDKIEKRSKEQNDRKTKLEIELGTLYGLYNGSFLQATVKDINVSKGLVKIRQDLISEYKCKTASELMLVDKIVSAYSQSMLYEFYINRFIEKTPGLFSFNDIQVRILKELHKGIELANRQFETGLALLQNLKQPKLNVKVTADSAFLAQNQQVINQGKSLEPNNLGENYEGIG